MNPSIRNKLDGLALRLEEINALRAEPGVTDNQDRFRQLSIEYAELTPVVNQYQAYCRAWDELEAARAMLTDQDSAMRAMAQEEIAHIQARIEQLEQQLQKLLLPKDPYGRWRSCTEAAANTAAIKKSLPVSSAKAPTRA